MQDNIFTECPGPGWVQQAMIMVLSVSLRKRAVVGLGISQSHLEENKMSKPIIEQSPGNSAPPAPLLGSGLQPNTRELHGMHLLSRGITKSLRKKISLSRK